MGDILGLREQIFANAQFVYREIAHKSVLHLALFHSENPSIYYTELSYAEMYVGLPVNYKKLCSGPVGSTPTEALGFMLDQMAAELEVHKRYNAERMENAMSEKE